MVSANDPCSLSGRRAAPRRGWSCGFSRKIADSIVKQRNRRSPAFSRHDMRPSYERTALGNQKRAQGMPGAGRNPWPPCIKKARGRNLRFSRIIRHSPRDGFNAYVALPGNRAFLLPSPAIISRAWPQRREARTTRFCVRNGSARLASRRVHRIPLSTSVTIAKRPSCEGGTGRL